MSGKSNAYCRYSAIDAAEEKSNEMNNIMNRQTEISVPSAILSFRVSKNCEQCKTGLANNSEGDIIVNLELTK